MCHVESDPPVCYHIAYTSGNKAAGVMREQKFFGHHEKGNR